MVLKFVKEFSQTPTRNRLAKYVKTELDALSSMGIPRRKNGPIAFFLLPLFASFGVSHNQRTQKSSQIHLNLLYPI